MALTVYTVDKHTRLVLPPTNWGASVLQKLRELGYTVEATTQSYKYLDRDSAELERRDCLLAETGM